MRSIYYKKCHMLNQIFGFKVPLDGTMMLLCKRPVIDLASLDDILMKNFNYTGSMKDFVVEQEDKNQMKLF